MVKTTRILCIFERNKLNRAIMKPKMSKKEIIYVILMAILAACIVRTLWTTYFFKIAYTSDGSDNAWWYVPQAGWNKGQLKGALISIVIMTINALPFLQWKKTSWTLPLYDYKTPWLRRLFLPLNYLHWAMFLIVFPLCTWAYYGTMPSTPWPYAPDEIAHGYHPDDFADFWFLSLGMLGLCYTLLQEVVLGIRRIRRK